MKQGQEFNLDRSMSCLLNAAKGFKRGKVSAEELYDVAIGAAEIFAMYKQTLKNNGITLPTIMINNSKDHN